MIRHSDLVFDASDMLVLRVLRRARMHGWGITRRLSEVSRDVVKIDELALAASLHRMQDRGWIEVAARTSADRERMPVYRLTRQGHRQFKRIVAEYERVTNGIVEVLERA